MFSLAARRLLLGARMSRKLATAPTPTPPSGTKRFMFRAVVASGCLGLVGFAATYPFAWTTAPASAMPGIFASALERYLRNVAAVTKIIYIYKTGLTAEEKSAEREQQLNDCHHESARVLRDLFDVNKGIYIKLGQHLGLLDYVIPQEYVDSMKTMFDRAPVSSSEDVKRVIEEDLGRPISEIFSDFDFEPLASASLAQVHRATMQDGQRVAVKVQHAGLREQSVGDIYTVAFLVEFVKRVFPSFNYTWLIEEIKVNLPRELDFEQEAANAKRCADMHKHRKDVHIPEIVDELTSSRVLTMEYCDGISLTDTQALSESGSNVLIRAAQIVSEVFSEQIFIHGNVHCDPHPGNVLVRPGVNGSQTTIVLLDHGLYRNLSDDFRLSYCKLWRALIEGDIEDIKKYSMHMNAGELYPLFAAMLTYKPWDDVIGDGSHARLEMTGSESEKATVRMNVAKYFREINKLLALVPRDVLLLLKTNDCLHGIENSIRSALGHDNYKMVPGTTHTIMARYCLRGIRGSAPALSSLDHVREWRDTARVVLATFYLKCWWYLNVLLQRIRPVLSIASPVMSPFT